MSLRSQVEKIATDAAIVYVKLYYPTLIKTQNKSLQLGKVTGVQGASITAVGTDGQTKTVTNLSNRAVGNDSSILFGGDSFMLG